MAEANRRPSTGGTSETLQATDPTNAQVADIDLAKMSVDDKLNLLIHEMGMVKQLTQQMQQQQSELSQLNESLQTEMVQMNHTMSQQQLRIIDLEARSRRNNLLFFNIAEADQESDSDCKQALLDFLAIQLKLNDDQLSRVVFLRVHRLGRLRHGVAPNGQPWKPRPVIAGFRDFKCKQDILFRASELKGTQFAIREDFPAEIHSARGKLWDDFKNAKSQNLKARIVYPAKLVVDGRVVRDMFPRWGQWAVGRYVDNQERGTQIPESDTPLGDLVGRLPDAPIGDLVGRLPSQGASSPHDHAQHAMQTPSVSKPQAYQHPPPVPPQPPPAPLHSMSAPSSPPPPPLPPLPAPLNPPPKPARLHLATDDVGNAGTAMVEVVEGTIASPVAGKAATMPDRLNHVTSGQPSSDFTATTSVLVLAHRHDPDVNNTSEQEPAPVRPPRRHRDGGGTRTTTPQPMHNASPATDSASDSTSCHSNNGTASDQTGQVTNSLPNAVGTFSIISQLWDGTDGTMA